MVLLSSQRRGLTRFPPRCADLVRHLEAGRLQVAGLGHLHHLRRGAFPTFPPQVFPPAPPWINTFVQPVRLSRDHINAGAGVCVQAKIEDMSAQAQSAAAEQFKAPDMSEAQAATAVADAAAQPAIEEVDDDDDDAVRPHTRPPSLETVT